MSDINNNNNNNKIDNKIDNSNNNDKISKNELKKLQKQQYKEQKKADKKAEKKLNKEIKEQPPVVIEQKVNFEEPKSDREAYQIEVKHVREIYDRIALHFDSTRYKAWPIVENFLNSRETGSIGCDVGCGNGKYLGVNKNVHLVGSDICNNFATICNEKKYEALVADGLFLPYQSNSFDFAISIAVIHHFSTFERRVEALREIIRVLNKDGILLITSWAMTQKWKGKSYENQDVMVPWLFQNQFDMSNKQQQDSNNNNQLIDNNNKNQQQQQQQQDSSNNNQQQDNSNNSQQQDNSNNNQQQQQQQDNNNKVEKSGSQYELYHRYYHLFEDGEFERMVNQIPECILVENNLDHDNYYCFIKKK